MAAKKKPLDVEARAGSARAVARVLSRLELPAGASGRRSWARAPPRSRARAAAARRSEGDLMAILVVLEEPRRRRPQGQLARSRRRGASPRRRRLGGDVIALVCGPAASRPPRPARRATAPTGAARRRTPLSRPTSPTALPRRWAPPAGAGARRGLLRYGDGRISRRASRRASRRPASDCSRSPSTTGLVRRAPLFAGKALQIVASHGRWRWSRLRPKLFPPADIAGAKAHGGDGGGAPSSFPRRRAVTRGKSAARRAGRSDRGGR